MTAQTPVLPQPGAAPTAGTIDFETTKEVGYYHLVWRRFKARKIAFIAAITMAVLVIGCYVLPLFLPADCPDLTQINLGPFATGHSQNAICGVGPHFSVVVAAAASKTKPLPRMPPPGPCLNSSPIARPGAPHRARFRLRGHGPVSAAWRVGR